MTGVKGSIWCVSVCACVCFDFSNYSCLILTHSLFLRFKNQSPLVCEMLHAAFFAGNNEHVLLRTVWRKEMISSVSAHLFVKVAASPNISCHKIFPLTGFGLRSTIVCGYWKEADRIIRQRHLLTHLHNKWRNRCARRDMQMSWSSGLDSLGACLDCLFMQIHPTLDQSSSIIRDSRDKTYNKQFRLDNWTIV